MSYISVLDRRENPRKNAEKSIFFTDLNLHQIIKQIEAYWGENLGDLFYVLPEDAEGEDYRRAVYQDMKKEGLRELLFTFFEKMQELDKIQRIVEGVTDRFQIIFLQIRCNFLYCKLLEELTGGLGSYSFSSQGMQKLYQYLETKLQEEEFQTRKKRADRILAQVDDARMQIFYDKDYMEIAKGSSANGYETFLEECFPNHGVQFKSPFLSTEKLTELEIEILKIFYKKNKEFFKEAERFLKDYPECTDEVVERCRTELPYYLAYLKFEEKMQECGFAFSTPVVDEEKNMEARGLYDLALACVNLELKKPVVNNDFVYHPGESFFVVTGFNQGGKTTFARSLGQLVYFSKMGLDVPAEAATLPHFGNILTHFSVEESVESGRGKLMEELTRLAPMMKEEADHAFVVINELFTTAANYDACIMGKKVLEHFIDKGCKGIYVTHLHELSKAHEKVVSLSAMLNEQHIQTFKIERSEVLEVASAGNQIKKYRLTYEQIKERFS